MKITTDAIIPARKLTHYLLIERDEDDTSQFLALAGFTLDNPQDLETAIRQLMANYPAVGDGSNSYGDFYRVEGDLIGVNGRILGVTTIWICLSDDEQFRFVTLKPGRKVK
jgi:hypothetical protein